MKNLHYLLAILFLTGSTVLTSCGDNDDDETTTAVPTVAVQNITAPTDGYIAGATVAYEVLISSNNIDLEKIDVSVAYNAGTIDPGTGSEMTCTAFETEGVFVKKTTSATVNYNFVIPASVEVDDKITVSFTATDEDGGSKTVAAAEFTVVALVTAGPIDEYTAVLMGGQSNATEGSFYSVSTNEVLKQADANAASEKVDLIYYFGSANAATLCSPTDATVNGGDGNLSLATGLTTQNATVFGATTVDAAGFTAMVDDTEIAGLTELADTKKTELAVDDVIAFKTSTGKIGLIHVEAIDGEGAGSITINVKVQKDAPTSMVARF